MNIKSIFAAFATAIILFAGDILAASEPHGLLIYTDHPSTYVENCEFYSVDASTPVYHTIVRADGRRLQINSGGLWIEVDYPPLNSSADFEATANSNIKTIHELSLKYPQFKARLLAADAKWRNALEFNKQAQKLKTSTLSGTSESNGPMVLLITNGQRYDDAKLSSIEGDTATIGHSAGIARIPIASLTADQITALNTTSSAIQIDPHLLSEIEARKKAARPQPTKPTSAVSPTLSPIGANQTEKQALADSYLNEKWVEPEFGNSFSPTYNETVEFINGKIGPAKIGYTEKSQKIILKLKKQQIYVFDPKDLNPSVKYRSNEFGSWYVYLACKNNKRKIYWPNSYVKGDWVPNVGIRCADNLDAEKLATAFSHLILMFGGTEEAF